MLSFTHATNTTLKEPFNYDKIKGDLIHILSDYYESAPSSYFLDPLLRNWWAEKRPLYESLFHHKLKFSEPIDLVLSADEKSRIHTEFIEKKAFFESIDIDSLLTNRLQKDCVIEGKSFPKGMRVSKAIKQITSDTTVWEDYLRFQNSLPATGELCFSIDPIDFITMSLNGYGWDTCYGPEGEFQAAPFSYMTDGCTFVCYVKGRTPFNECGVDIDNKKWRVLVHFDPELPYLVFNNQYPFFSEEILQKASEILIRNLPSHLADSKICLQTVDRAHSRNLINYVDHSFGRSMFNDFYHVGPSGPASYPIYVLYPQSGLPPIEDLHPVITIGHSFPCLSCGDTLVLKARDFLCRECDGRWYEHCCTCAEEFEEDQLIMFRGEYYCEACYDDNITYCEKCDEEIRRVEYSSHQCG